MYTGKTGSQLAEMTANEAKFDYDYMVKYKNMSYQHVQWLSANDIGIYT